MQVRERGERAERLLNDAVFKDALDEAAKSVIDQWILSQDAVEREALWHKYHALDGLPRQLRIYRDRGKVEEKTNK